MPTPQKSEDFDLWPEKNEKRSDGGKKRLNSAHLDSVWNRVQENKERLGWSTNQ
jgi:hypothetical protein